MPSLPKSKQVVAHVTTIPGSKQVFRSPRCFTLESSEKRAQPVSDCLEKECKQLWCCTLPLLK